MSDRDALAGLVALADEIEDPRVGRAGPQCRRLWATRIRGVLASDWLAERDRRIKAEALREAADRLPDETEGINRAGTAQWPEGDREVYSLAIEEAQVALRDRADRIEPRP